MMAIAFLLLVLSVAAEEPVIYQRCRRPDNNNKDNGIVGSGECEVCDKKKHPQTAVPNVTKVQDRFHVVIQLTTSQLESDLLAITASLLHEHKAYVSLFFMDFTRTDINRQDYVQLLFQRILIAVPCADHSILQSRLAIRSISMPPTVKEFCSGTLLNYHYAGSRAASGRRRRRRGGGSDGITRRRSTTSSSYWEPLQSCSVLMATSQYRAYGSLWIDSINQRIEYPISVVVTDRFGLGALLLAEEWGVPSIMLTDEASLRRATQPQQQHQQSSSSSVGSSFPTSLRVAGQALKSLPNEIWRSLSGIISFAGLQQLRKALGLKRIRYRNEIWNAVTAILVLTNHNNNNNNNNQARIVNTLLPPLLPIRHPIFPPCLACNPNKSKSTLQLPTATTTTTTSKEHIPVVSVIVVQTPNTVWTASQQRKILRGLAKARKTLLIQASTPQSFETCPSALSNCWHERNQMELQVQWLLHNHDREGLQAASATNVNKNDNREEILFSNHSLVAPIPDFVVMQDAMLFTDIILQSVSTTATNPTIVLAPCEDNNARAAVLLQVATLCFLPPSATSTYHHNTDNLHYYSLQNFDEHEIAQHLLRLVWTWKHPSEKTKSTKLTKSHNNTSTSSSTSGDVNDNDGDDGLQRVVAAIRTAGSLRPIQQVRKSDPKLPQELQLFYSQIMISRGETLLLSQQQQQQQGGLSSLLMMLMQKLLNWTSWAVIISMMVCLGTRRFLPRMPRHIRRNIETIKIRYCLDAIRVSEVDKALEAVGRFWKDIRLASADERGEEKALNANGNRSNNNNRFSSDKNSSHHHKQSNHSGGRTNNHSNKKRMGKHR